MKHTDLIIVGAGIMGIAHALHASRAGMSVRVFDRSISARGASTRNFGMLAVIAQAAGQQMDDALRALDTWQSVGSLAGFSVDQTGCLVAARHAQELAVLQEFANSQNGSSTAKLLTPSQLSLYAPGLRSGNLLGGLWSSQAWKVDQQQAVGKIADWLQRKHGVQFHFSTSVDEINTPIVSTSNGEFSGDTVIVCAGNDFSTLFAEPFKASGVSQCELQMLRTHPQPSDWKLKPFILGGLSLPRYTAFSECNSLPDLEAMQQQHYGEYLSHGIHVIACQEHDGSITIGDSHNYSSNPPPERSNEIDELILKELHEWIALPETGIRQRWRGHYAHLPGTDVLKLSPAKNVLAVTATTGQGMTHAFSIAENVIEDIIS